MVSIGEERLPIVSMRCRDHAAVQDYTWQAYVVANDNHWLSVRCLNVFRDGTTDIKCRDLAKTYKPKMPRAGLVPCARRRASEWEYRRDPERILRADYEFPQYHMPRDLHDLMRYAIGCWHRAEMQNNAMAEQLPGGLEI